MDNRLVLTVLLVTLSWMCLGTGAQTTASQNMTTPMHNMTNNMTTPMHNMTNNMTTPMHNMTNNMTTPMNNMTGPMQNMTTPMPNVTVPATATTTATTTTTTTAPPLTPNTTVQILNITINRQGCGRQQLCAAQPADCDPSTSGSCFFLGVKQTSGANFEFQLTGESDGYLAASLSPDSTAGGNDTTYVCANNNGVVRFFGAVLNNGRLILTPLRVNNVKGRVNGNTIQCTFAATVPSSTARTTANFAVGISTGSYNATSGALGNPVSQLMTGVVDLSNPNSTITNMNSNTTTISPGTTSHSVSLQQCLSQALLITLGMVGLALL